MTTTKESYVFTHVVQPIEADMQASKLNRQKLASLIWGDREPPAAYHKLQNKLTLNRKPDFTIQEVIYLLKVAEQTENTMRFLCEQWGYNMPTRKSENEPSVAEEEIKKIDSRIARLHDSLIEEVSQKKELESKINRVQKCENDYQKTETNLTQAK